MARERAPQDGDLVASQRSVLGTSHSPDRSPLLSIPPGPWPTRCSAPWPHPMLNDVIRRITFYLTWGTSHVRQCQTV